MFPGKSRPLAGNALQFGRAVVRFDGEIVEIVGASGKDVRRDDCESAYAIESDGLGQT